jgi:hypothetical protein
LIGEVFASAQVPVSLPLLYSVIKSRAVKGRVIDPSDLIQESLRLRASKEARSYRAYCEKLETSLQSGDLVPVSEAREEVEALAAQWSRSLGKSKGKRTWSISALIPGSPLQVGTEVETRWPTIGSADRQPQFVFLHGLLSDRGADAAVVASPLPR